MNAGCCFSLDKDINRRRLAEEYRKRRIFNSKQRQIGIDVQALNYQVHEHLLARSRETEREKHFAEEAKRQRDLAELLERERQNEIFEKNKKIDEFRKSEQKPEHRKDFDLYDPNQKKKERPPRAPGDDNFPVSGIQKFEGEDKDVKDRSKKQKNQVRDFLLQQMQEKRMQHFKEDKEKQDWESLLLHQDRFAVQLAQEEAEMNRKAFADLNIENRGLAIEKNEDKNRERIVEDIEKKKDIQFNIQSDLLTEDPFVGRSSMGPNRVVSDRWKGMSKKQLEEFRKGQIQQMVERKRRKEQEQYEKEQWDEQIINQENLSLYLEEEQKNRQFKSNKMLDCENQELAHEQRQQREFLENVVYKNCVSKEYFHQFNTTSR